MPDKDLNTRVSVLETLFEVFKDRFSELKDRVEDKYLTKDVFDEWRKPIDRIFWGVIWIIISAVVVGILTLVTQ